MRVLVTGHTGFKGSWLSLMLKHLGHEVHGLSVNALPDSLFVSASLLDQVESNHFVDIRDFEALKTVLEIVKPEFIFHLAAQALVLEGYKNPYETFEINVSGTNNVIQASIESKVPYLTVVTSDKVYKQKESPIPFIESDSLGGKDPYSASKAAADLLTQCWAENSKTTKISIVRAGNVIGGGDYGADRLIPDLVRAHSHGKTAIVRFPEATRPWQHVLDCLSGYLRVLNHMFEGGNEGIWNVGPINQASISVRDICKHFEIEFENPLVWKELIDKSLLQTETLVLALNSTKMQSELDWRPKLVASEALEWTLRWYKDLSNGGQAYDLTMNQVEEYMSLDSF